MIPHPMLAGKVAIVTGAGRGIGARTAQLLAEHGATLVVTDVAMDAALETAANIREAGGQATAIHHDVTSSDDWKAVLAHVEATHRRLDVLVNNAGIMLTKPFLQTTLEDFRQSQTINVESIFIGTQLAHPLLAATHLEFASHPSVINLSSVFGQVVGRWHTAYCASKGAVRLMTKAMAVELARSGSGIRVNSVHPGPTDTPLGVSGIEAAVEFGAIESVDAGKRAFWANIPMGRIGEPEDIAGAIAFLASDASRFMTGSELTVDGGYTLL